MLESLDEFGRQTAEEIIDAFPQWASLLSLEEEHGERAMVLTVQAPSNNFVESLRIDTFGSEVTVYFDCTHMHFEAFDDGTDKDAVSLIRRLIAEQVVIVSYWRDDLLCGSAVLPPVDAPKTNDEHPYANRVRVRSWTGRFDEEIACLSRD